MPAEGLSQPKMSRFSPVRSVPQPGERKASPQTHDRKAPGKEKKHLRAKGTPIPVPAAVARSWVPVALSPNRRLAALRVSLTLPRLGVTWGGGAQASVSPVPGMIWVQLEGRVARACDGEACESQQPRWELKMACVLTGGARLAGRRGRRRRWWRRRGGGGFGFIVIPLLCRRLAPGGRRQSARGRPPSDEAKAQKTLREMHNFPSVGFPRRQTGSGGRAGVGGGEVLSRVAAPARRTGYGRWRSLFSAKDAAPSVFAALSSGAARSLLHPVFVHVHT